jgi:D-alanyl-D-alanine carboxypeptidase (penicillin-binding protein 5/6)
MDQSKASRILLIFNFTWIWLLLLSLMFGSNRASASAAETAHYQPFSPPPVSAKAVYVTDATAGTELFSLNPDEPLPPASLTKIVAALVILDETKLDDRVEILKEDLVSADESQVGLVAGDTLSVHDLLVGALVPSGNDATLALARFVGTARLGQTATPAQAVAEFVSLMNAKAAALGATASHFVNPTGIDADGHVMSARDLAKLASVALQNPIFAEIVNTSKAVLHSDIVTGGYSVTTTNSLLLEGVVSGVKTGSTPKAGGCLVSSYAVGPNQIIAVVLGSQLSETEDGLQDASARFSDTRELMKAASEDYVWLDPSTPGVVAGLADELLVWDVDLGPTTLLPVPADDASQLRYRLVLTPPAAPQSPAGEIEFFVGDKLLSERPALQAS